MNKGKFHKSCKNKFSDLKLEREQKKKKLGQVEGDVNCEDNEPDPDTIESFNVIGTRKHLSTSSSCLKKECVFCSQSDGDLHRTSTF